MTASLACLVVFAPSDVPAQRMKVQALATVELGHVSSVGPFAGVGSEFATLWPQFEARISLNRMGRATGCLSGGCDLRDLTLWELGLGIPVSLKRGSVPEWALGIGVGSASEKYDQRRFAKSLYIARTWQPVGSLSIRLEGRSRALEGRNGRALRGATIKLGVGVTP